MITIAMVKQPMDFSQHMWTIPTKLFIMIHGANEQWPGVKAYRLTGQEKYYEPTWVPDEDSTGLEQVIQATPNVELIPSNVQCVTEVAEDAVPSTERVEEDTMCSNIQRKPLTFINIKTKG